MNLGIQIWKEFYKSYKPFIKPMLWVLVPLILLIGFVALIGFVVKKIWNKKRKKGGKN